MKLESFKSETKEIYMTGNGISVTVTHWGNCEGCNVMVLADGKEMTLRMAGAFRWEELDILIAALAASRSS